MSPRFLAALCVLATSVVPAHAADNTLTAREKSEGWQLLFDGKSFNGWRGYRKTAMPEAGWVIKDGLLGTVAKVRGSDIVTDRKFNDFELSWEWKVEPKGNNGVKYFVTEDKARRFPGHEYQMLDDVGHPDGKIGPHRQTASFYEVLAPAADKPLRPPGEWNQSRVVVRGKKVEHWLNGKNVLTYELGSEAVKAGIAKSKFKDEVGFGDKIAGHIMLTYHQDESWYRNIKIRELK